MGRGLKVGTVAGAPVLLSPWWFVLAAVLTWWVAPLYRGWLPDLGRAGEIGLGATFVALLYGSAFLHELGHAYSARAYGLRVHRIQLTAIGGLTEMESPQTPGRAAVTSGSGPAVNVALAVVGAAALHATTPATLPHLLAGQLAFTNALLAVVNLLPGLPLDGGTIVRAAIWKLTGRTSTATIATAWVGRVLAVLLGLWALRNLSGGTSYISPLWAVLVALWMFSAASAAIATEHARARVPNLSARTLARPAVTVRADEPVSVVVARIRDAGAKAAVVVDSDGRVTGIVSEAAITAAPEERWPWIEASTVSRRVDPTLRLDADLTGEALMRALAHTPAAEYVIEEPSAGGLVGVLTFADVEAALQRR